MKFLPGILVIVLCAASALAQTQTPPPAPKVATPIPAPAKVTSLKYKTPGNTAAHTRKDIDAATRGWNTKMPAIYVLAPNHTGLTTHAQPVLFWYQSGPASTPIEITLIEPGKPKPLLRVGAEHADQPGIHRLLLSRHNFSLEPGVLYKWTVALVPDATSRSQDVIASDTIQRVEPETQMATALSGARGLDKAAIYARNGIWYDALETVTNEIDAAPKNKELRLQRAALLEQGELKAVVASERK
jgi:hypothetical protein